MNQISARSPNPYRFTFDGFVLDLSSRSLQYHSARVWLTPKEFDLLSLLVAESGRPVSKDEILSRIWPDQGITEAAMSQTVYRLRRTLARHEPSVEFISTLPGKGFQFVGHQSAEGTLLPMPGLSDPAFQQYRRGAIHLAQRTRQSLEKSIDEFSRCLEATPAYVPALIGLAQAFALSAKLLYIDPRAGYAKVRRYAMEALRLDPLAGEAHAILADALIEVDRDTQRAAYTLANAISLAPYSIEVRTVAAWECLARGDSSGALFHVRSALAVEPASIQLTTLLGIALYFAGHFEDAHSQFDDALHFDSTYPLAQYYDVRALCAAGVFDFALQRLDAIADGEPAGQVLALRGYAEAKRGRPAAADAVVNQLRRLPIPSHIALATVALGYSRFEDVAKELAGAISSREPLLLFVASDPLFADFRRWPGSQATLEAIRMSVRECCERCMARFDRDRERFTCKRECAFCEECARRLEFVCPNCGGVLRRAT